MESILLRTSFIVVLLFAGCSSGQSTDGLAAANGTRTAKSAPKHAVLAMMSEPGSLVARMNFAQISLPGASNLEQLVNGSLVEIDGSGNVLPQFAMAVPSQDNGLWSLTPEGGMTTTWKLRRGVRWHDGTPLTAGDFVFAFDVDRDKEIPSRRPIWYEYVTGASAPDPDTITLT
jgi:peptide/nickel transport system substrate-binding protein